MASAVRAMSIRPARLAALTQLRCQLTETSYNSQSLRTGAKYLRARLRGPSMVSYYPAGFDIARIIRQYPALEMVDDDEEERLVDVLDRKKRGKGAPKKAKTKCESCFLVSGSFLYIFWCEAFEGFTHSLLILFSLCGK